MLCNVCRQHAQFERTVFHDASPTRLRLCEGCADQVQLVEHMHRITEAVDHATKTAAVDSLLAAVAQAKAASR